MGLGKSNLAIAKLLDSLSINFQVHDKKMCSDYIKFENSKVEFFCGKNYLKNLDCDLVFRSPGIRPDLIRNACLKKNVIFSSEIELFLSFCRSKNLFVVTGSDGKSTTASLIYELLKISGKKVFIGGNIGFPMLPKIECIFKEDFVVLELSSFQLMTCNINPKVAVITNISENHLDWHKNFDEYVNSKINVFKNQEKCNLSVYNFDCEILNRISEKYTGKKRFFSIKCDVVDGCFLDTEGYINFCEGGVRHRVIHRNEIKIVGNHNVENFMAAISSCYDFVGLSDIKYVANNFGGLPHRIEFVAEIAGVSYYDDSIASSPNRVLKGAFSTFENNIILIAGGYDKNLNFEEFGKAVCNKVKVLILIGQTAGKIENCIKNCSALKKPKIFRSDSMKNAVELANANALEKDVVLLSPACASFGMYNNFEERGNDFKNCVLNLKKC